MPKYVSDKWINATHYIVAYFTDSWDLFIFFWFKATIYTRSYTSNFTKKQNCLSHSRQITNDDLDRIKNFFQKYQNKENKSSAHTGNLFGFGDATICAIHMIHLDKILQLNSAEQEKFTAGFDKRHFMNKLMKRETQLSKRFEILYSRVDQDIHDTTVNRHQCLCILTDQQGFRSWTRRNSKNRRPNGIRWNGTGRNNRSNGNCGTIGNIVDDKRLLQSQ